MLSKSTSFTFSRNELRLIEYSSSSARRRCSIKIIIKKEFENYLEDVIMKEFFELSNQFYEDFVKSTFCYYTEAQWSKIKSISKCERFRYLCRDFRDRSRQIYIDSIKKLFFQQIEKEDSKEV